MTRLLIADDDVELTRLLADYLERQGFEVSAVHRGDEVAAALGDQRVDLLILDVMLPGMDGFDVLRALGTRASVPVLMLTARGDDIDRIVGLELGADDYLPKPCNPRELVARIKAILRRCRDSGGDDRELLQGRRLAADRRRREATCDGRPLALTSAEWAVLVELLAADGRVVSREQLARRALGRPLMAYDRSVDVHVSNLRKKLRELDAQAQWILAVRGAGYQLVDD